jgi:hypothetical protein
LRSVAGSCPIATLSIISATNLRASDRPIALTAAMFSQRDRPRLL